MDRQREQRGASGPEKKGELGVRDLETEIENLDSEREGKARERNGR